MQELLLLFFSGTSARLAFIRQHGLDPIDIPTGRGAPLSAGQPLEPLVKALERRKDEWPKLYRKACDDLLDQLVTRWRELKKDSPVWVIDTFAGYDGSHDWSRFRDRVEGVLCDLGTRTSPRDDYPGHGLKRMELMRAYGDFGTFIYAETLKRSESEKKSCVVLDFSFATRRDDLLKMITGP